MVLVCWGVSAVFSWFCSFGLVFCVGGFFGRMGRVQMVLVCLGVSAVYLIRVSVSSLRSLLQGMETDEVSSKYNFLTVISNHHRIFFSLVPFSEKDELLYLNLTLYLGAFLPELAYCQSDKSE